MSLRSFLGTSLSMSLIGRTRVESWLSYPMQDREIQKWRPAHRARTRNWLVCEMKENLPTITPGLQAQPQHASPLLPT